MVAAESEEIARKLAVKAFQDEHVYPQDFQLKSLSYIPAPYSDDLQDLVWSDGPEDLTLEEALKLPGGYNHPDVVAKREAKNAKLREVSAKLNVDEGEEAYKEHTQVY